MRGVGVAASAASPPQIAGARSLFDPDHTTSERRAVS